MCICEVETFRQNAYRANNKAWLTYMFISKLDLRDYSYNQSVELAEKLILSLAETSAYHRQCVVLITESV